MNIRLAAPTASILVILVCGSLFVVPSARAQTTPSQNLVISGVLPIFNYGIDLCKAILGFTSCPVSASISENYNQAVSLVVENSPDMLQPQTAETSQLTLNPGNSIFSLDLNFSLGTNYFATVLPLPSLPVPGTLPVSISIDSILAEIVSSLGLPIPVSLLSLVADLKLNLFFTTLVRGAVETQGLTSNTQTLDWNVPDTTNLYNAVLTGQPSTAKVSLSELDSVFAFGGDLTLKLLLSSFKLHTFQNTTMTFGSTNSQMTIANWYHLIVQSPYSQTAGSGWYLSGTQTTFSVSSTTVPVQNGNYIFAGWIGTGAGSYSGTGQSESITATGPVNETANWNYVASVSPASILAPVAWAIGTASVLGLIIVRVAVVVGSPA